MLGLVTLTLALGAAPGSAGELFDRAEQEESTLAFAAALRDYEASLALDPSNRDASRAAARVGWLTARAEGGFAPLEALERVRRNPGARDDVAVVDRLAQELEAFPIGEVRTEARLFVAEAYDLRLARPKDAERELHALLEEAAGDPPLRAEAARRLVDMASARGDERTALFAAAQVPADRVLGTRVRRWVRRRLIERVAYGVVGLFAAASVFGSVRAKVLPHLWRAVLARTLGACSYLALGGAGLALAYPQGDPLPFLLLPLSLAPVMVFASAWGLAGGTVIARGTRAVLGATAVAAIGFLVLEKVNVRYLESFGL